MYKDVDKNLIKSFHVILRAISSGHGINLISFQDFTLQTARNFVQLLYIHGIWCQHLYMNSFIVTKSKDSETILPESVHVQKLWMTFFYTYYSSESIVLKFIPSQSELFRFIPISVSEKHFVSRLMKNGKKLIRLHPINSETSIRVNQNHSDLGFIQIDS